MDSNKITETDEKIIGRYVDDFCMSCGYLHPEAKDPCEGCKMQEFVDSLYKDADEKISEYKENKEREITVMEEHLKGIIETENAAADERTAEGLRTLSDNGKLLASPVLMRKAAKRFHELFWNDEQVMELAMDAADRAVIKTVNQLVKKEK